MAESERNIGGKITVERRFFISSLAENAKNFGLSIRKHCAIENSLHWVLDVTFNEDDSRTRRDNVAENLVVMRHFALNNMRADKRIRVGVNAKR